MSSSTISSSPVAASTVFQKAYDQLNPEQKLAVDTIDGPVMVIAGPGTGKTQILATRIANILLTTDTQPWSILALTFTESAAQNMKQRLLQLIGPTAYSVNVQTFHSFCDGVIREYPEFFPINRDSQILSELERYDIFENLLKNPHLKALRTTASPFHYLKTIVKSISDLKREGISVVRFQELVEAEAADFATAEPELSKTEKARQQRNLAKNQELAQLYQQYQEQLQKLKRYDYDDMISLVAEAFAREESLLLEYQEKLTYFLVDEYQDTNAAQNTVVDLLASYWGDQANIFVVGDPNQSIYRFQGASLENTLSFAKRYPQAKMITLATGYRSPQEIYDVAAQIIQASPATSEAIALKSVHGQGSKIQVYVAPSSTVESVFVAEEIQKLLGKGVSPAEIAVLFRNNADSALFSEALTKWHIPFQVQTNEDVLNQPEIVQFLKLCQVILDLRTAQESLELYEVLNYPWVGVDHLLAMTIARAAGKSRMTIYERICKGYTDFAQLQLNDHITPLDFEILQQLVEKLEKWGQLDAEMTFPAWFELVLNESGYLQYVTSQPNKIEVLMELNGLFREVKNLSAQAPSEARHFHLQEFMNAIATMREHGVQIAVEEFQPQQDAVTLSTVHKAKGLEWQYVFLVQLIDSKWGNSRKISGIVLPPGILQYQDPSEAERLADDRRLFYVAITRAKKQLIISYPETLISNNQSKTTLPSVFLSEIQPTYLEKIERPELQQKTEEYLVKFLTPTTPVYTANEHERAWLTQVVSQYRLSVSGLNQYLRSPEMFLDETILRVPKARPEYQAFGTAMHSALEFVFRQVQETAHFPPLALAQAAFERALDKEVLTPDQHFSWVSHGQQVLSEYLAEYAGQARAPLFLEKKLGYGAPLLLDTIPLVGQIDRMEWADDSHTSLCVIDYKTGKPRTQNEIEGKVSTQDYSERELALPEPIRGPYKRQLLFYKLLVELDRSFKQKVTTGVFDFVEPNETGKFVQRQFTLLDEDVELLKSLIKTVMSEIRDLKFLDAPLAA